MSHGQWNWRALTASMTLAVMVGAVLVGCQTADQTTRKGEVETGSPVSAEGGSNAATPGGSKAEAAAPAEGGAQLWSQNCGRCHNYRDPGEFSDAEWAVIIHHMRVRVPLYGKDADAILTFLQGSN